MTYTLHKAESRGRADYGWLVSRHTFSFANYFNSQRTQFGVLRVINDDVVAANRGFSMHAHENMEIATIPLEGDLAHKDSLGNSSAIKQGDIQVISAGAGIQHSEYNANNDKPVKLLQIWILPNRQNVNPRYDQFTIEPQDLKNRFFQILSPNANSKGVWIYQNAYFYLADLDENIHRKYLLNDSNHKRTR